MKDLIPNTGGKFEEIYLVACGFLTRRVFACLNAHNEMGSIFFHVVCFNGKPSPDGVKMMNSSRTLVTLISTC